MTKSGDPTKSSADDRDRTITRLEKALGDALTRIEAAESMLDDQQQRLKALGVGREETMRALTDTRDELRRVSRERDELRKQLTRVDSIQTSTLALPSRHAPGTRQAGPLMPGSWSISLDLPAIACLSLLTAGHRGGQCFADGRHRGRSCTANPTNQARS